MRQMDRIELNPRVCNGKPVIKGTRMPVSVILDQIAEDGTWNGLLDGYPELTKEDIQGSLELCRGLSRPLRGQSSLCLNLSDYISIKCCDWM